MNWNLYRKAPVLCDCLLQPRYIAVMLGVLSHKLLTRCVCPLITWNYITVYIKLQ